MKTYSDETRHGWVVPRSDGLKARCGGPAICKQCAEEKLASDLLGEIARMSEDDIDTFLQDENRWPSNGDDSRIFREACFRRLAELQRTTR